MNSSLLIWVLLLNSCAYKTIETNAADKRSNIEYYKTIAKHHLNDKKNNNCYGNNLVGFFYFEGSKQTYAKFKVTDIEQVTKNIYLVANQYQQLVKNLNLAYSLPEYKKIKNLIDKLLITFKHDIFEPNKFITNEAHVQNLFKTRLQTLEEIDNFILRLPLFEPLSQAMISIDYRNITNEERRSGIYLKSSDDKVLASGRGRIKLHLKPNDKPIIEIKHSNNLSSFYEKLSEILVKDDDIVEASQIIANASEIAGKEKMIYYFIKYDNKFIKPNIFMFHHFNCE